MNILFLGLGSIGRKHASIINKLYPSYNLFAFSNQTQNHNIPYIHDLNSTFEIDQINFDCCFVCSPTFLHIDDAIFCANRKIPIFLEKPICSNINEYFKLLNIIYRNRLTCYIAYPFRFHKELNEKYEEIKMFSNNKLKITSHTNINNWGKKSYSFSRKTGGGVIFELSHELDIAVWIYGGFSNFRCSNIERDKDKINVMSNITLYHDSGDQTKLHLSIDSKVDERKIKYGGIELKYEANEQMYVDQIKYFFGNLDNLYLMNNIFEASNLFFNILKMEGVIK